MLKYTDTQIVFREVPDEITLAINLSNCVHHCDGCHSPYLAGDIGEELTPAILTELCNKNNGITCVSFMGGNPAEVNTLAEFLRLNKPELKVAWYTGDGTISKDIDLENFNFIKVGPYKKEYGALDSKTTNQRFYKVVKVLESNYKLEDITYQFWKH